MVELPLVRNYSKTPAERRERLREIFLSRREALDPEARPIFRRELVHMVTLEAGDFSQGEPAVHNGDYPVLEDPAYQAESKADDEAVDDARQRARQVHDAAMNCGDLTNANLAVNNLIRMLPRKHRKDDKKEMEALSPSPGPAGRPLTEDETKRLEDFRKISLADRMLMYEGWEAAMHYLELGGNIVDLVRPRENTISTPRPEEDSGESLARGPEDKQ